MFKTRFKTADLYRAMQREGISQNETARRAGIARGTISAVMNGKCCGQRVAKAICEAVRADPDDLLEVVEE